MMNKWIYICNLPETGPGTQKVLCRYMLIKVGKSRKFEVQSHLANDS